MKMNGRGRVFISLQVPLADVVLHGSFLRCHRILYVEASSTVVEIEKLICLFMPHELVMMSQLY